MCEIGGESKKNFVKKTRQARAGGGGIFQRTVVVQTSIDPSKVKFVQEIPKRVIVSDLIDQEYDFVIAIEVLDKDDNGVPGKYPTKLITKTNNSSDSNKIGIMLADEIDHFEASRDDGVITIPIKVTKLLDTIVASITLIIDDIPITTTFIEFYLDEDAGMNVISKIEYTQLPIDDFERGLDINQQFTVKAVAYNLLGQIISSTGYFIKPMIYFHPSTQAQVPSGFFIMNCLNYSSGSEMVFTWNFDRAPTGHFYFGIFAYFESVFYDPNYNEFM